MKKICYCFIVLLFLIATILLYQTNTKQTQAIYDPLSVANNKIGIHILFPDELDKAKELVNSNGGDWGYVVIPIQSADKDIKKWQAFMDNARALHIIPIIRLATHNDFFEKSSWKKPEDTDVVDFANFLDSLDWPVKNRYVIIFNEVNRGDEWEGKSDPAEYARLLSYATVVFKSKTPDFFIISAGLDNASITAGNTYNQFDFMRLMNQEVPGIFNQIDGISSHSYPNPAFSQPPTILTSRSISSFLYELEEIGKYTNKKLPVFITETGWDQEILTDEVISDYFKEALSGVWNDPQIVTIAPFLLKAGLGPFEKFSFMKGKDEQNEIFQTFVDLPKTKGVPTLFPPKKVLGGEVSDEIPVKDFSNEETDDSVKNIKKVIKWFLLGP